MSTEQALILVEELVNLFQQDKSQNKHMSNSMASLNDTDNKQNECVIEKIENADIFRQSVIEKIENAEAIVIGIGAGMSASGGINYTDSNLAQKWFPEYYSKGLKSIVEIQSVFWWWGKMNFNEQTILSYWGYWAKHIDNIRYKSELLPPYKNLVKIMKNKNYFIITTNADGQTQKSGFDKNKIFAPQGNYDAFQCMKPCSRDRIYANKEMIKNMVSSVNKDNKINNKFIPRCSHCKSYLIPNLRCDDTFIEKPHMKNMQDYQDFISNNSDKNIVFLELGVGFNTAGVIRIPFEKMTYKLPKATLIRVNKGMANVSKQIENKSISVDEDINKVLVDYLNIYGKNS
eukprot:484101_1